MGPVVLVVRAGSWEALNSDSLSLMAVGNPENKKGGYCTIVVGPVGLPGMGVGSLVGYTEIEAMMESSVY
jgi:hypothetical protein